jgi:hypothetical protein
MAAGRKAWRISNPPSHTAAELRRHNPSAPIASPEALSLPQTLAVSVKGEYELGFVEITPLFFLSGTTLDAHTHVLHTHIRVSIRTHANKRLGGNASGAQKTRSTTKRYLKILEKF